MDEKTGSTVVLSKEHGELRCVILDRASNVAKRVPLEQAHAHVFGAVLRNDGLLCEWDEARTTIYIVPRETLDDKRPFSERMANKDLWSTYYDPEIRQRINALWTTHVGKTLSDGGYVVSIGFNLTSKFFIILDYEDSEPHLRKTHYESIEELESAVESLFTNDTA